MLRTLRNTAAAVALFATALCAHAGFLANTIEATAYFPDLPPGATTTAGPFSAVVGAGVEFADGLFLPFFGPSFDFADTTITITHAPTSHSPGTFNGYSFFDVFATIDPIVGVDIISDGSGFFSGDPSRIFFDADHVYVNFEGLSFTSVTDRTIVLSVRFDGAAPEPGTLALVALALLGASVRRRKAG